MNRIHCLGVTLVVLSVQATAFGVDVPPSGVTTSGDVVLIDTPTVPITKGRLDSANEIFLFQEQFDTELVEPVLVDIRQPGSYPPLTLPPPMEVTTFVPAGTPVDVYLMHFDPGRRMPPFDSPPGAALSGSVTFDYPIAGVIVRGPQFFASEELEHPEVDYMNYADLEIGASFQPRVADMVELSDDRRTLSVDLAVTIAFDQVRILVARVPEPSTVGLTLLGLTALGVVRYFRS